MANIQKSLEGGLKGSNDDNDISIQMPQVNDNEEPEVIVISDDPVSNIYSVPISFDKKYKEDINKYSVNELKEKIEHIKNAVKNNNSIDKNFLKSLDNILSTHNNLNNNVVFSVSPMSSPFQIKKHSNKSEFLDVIDEEDEELNNDSEDEMPPLEDVKSQKEYNYNESKNMDEDFVKSFKKEESENMVEIDTDGIDYETYANIPFKNRMKFGKSIGFCESCSKYYPDFIIVEHDGMPYCWHCLFWLTNTSMFGDKELEQTYGLSLEKYVEFCGPSHNKVDCFRSVDCVLCNNSPNFETPPASDNEGSTEDFENLVLELDI